LKTYPYLNINDTLGAILFQIKRSLPWARQNTNLRGETAEELFYRFKDLVKYKKDPKGNELLQSCKTFVTGKYYGEKFTGDCDCFTIFTLTMLLANGFKPDQLAIVLVGKTKKFPSHIYSMVNGQAFDLTENLFNSQRPYTFRQIISLKDFLP